ncbi:PAS domain S-box protein [Falsiroseomonas sp. CW058]|uniref:PAS domain S-box protein n=1 Tax=Falsiroseomonas sp. CW058 TaxID=3388664 RepID=UPI003D3147FD
MTASPVPPLPRLRLSVVLLLLVLAVLLPALGVGGLAVWQAVGTEQAAAEARLRDTAGALALAVDREIAAQVAALTGLATSPAFGPDPARPDLPALDSHARRVAAALGTHLSVLRRDGTRVQSTALPPGAPLPPSTVPEAIERAFATGRPVVTDLVTGAIARVPVFSVTLPVRDAEGGVAMAVMAAFRTERLRDLLAAQGLPAGAFASIADARAMVVARSDALHDAAVGRPLPAGIAAAIAEGRGGLFRGPDGDGAPRVHAFRRLDTAPGWTLVVAQPALALDARWQGPLSALVAGGGLTLLLGGALALLAGGSILRPMGRLGAHAAAVATGRADAHVRAIPPAAIREVEALRRGFVEAEAAIAARGAALAESEARFRAMADSAPAMVWATDAAGRCTYVSRPWRDFTGQSEEEGLGLGWLDAVHPEDRDKVREAFLAATARAEPYRVELRLRRAADGGWATVIDAAMPRLGPGGEFLGFIGSAVDISDRVAAEAALCASEARLRLATGGTGIGTWELDLRTGQGFNSPEAAALFGIDILAVTAESWVEAIHPADRAGAAAGWRRAVEEGAPYEAIFRAALPAPDGGERWLASRAWIERDGAGRPLRALGVLIDVTTQKRAEERLRLSEERFRAAVRAVSGILWTNTAEGRMAGEQPGWAALTGQSFAEYQGYGWARAVHPEDAQPTVEAWNRAVAERRPFVFEHRVRTRDGAWRRFAIHAVPVLRGDGEVAEWVGVHTDVTRQREAEAVLARSREELERLVAERTAALAGIEARLAQAAKMEALGRLAGGIAHDFNNVLQAVAGGISLAGSRLGRDPAAAARYLDLAAEAAGRGVAVTGRLLAFARRGELVAAPVAPAPLLAGLATMLRHGLGPSVVLRVEARPDLPAVLADAGQLEAVLVNLANNARDALPDGVGTIELAAEEPAEEREVEPPPGLAPGAYVCISVTDDGSGMTPEVLARVTEPFFTTKPNGKGTGLGLAMARGFAEQSGGALTVESTAGRSRGRAAHRAVAGRRPRGGAGGGRRAGGARGARGRARAPRPPGDGSGRRG